MKKKLLLSVLGASMMLLGAVCDSAAAVEYMLKLSNPVTVQQGVASAKVVFMNTSEEDGQAERCQIPSEIDAALILKDGKQMPITLKSSLKPEWVQIPPGTFKSREYTFSVPDGAAINSIMLDGCPAVSAHFAQTSDAKTLSQTTTLGKNEVTVNDYVTGEMGKKDAELQGDDKSRSAVIDYLKEHFYTYDPTYFIVGGNPSGGLQEEKGNFPNARFQISLRYAPFSQDGWMAQKWHGFTNICVTYTQNTVWDLEGESAPFLDSTFKPELVYLWQDVLKEPKGILRQLDLMASLSHESNGRSGSGSRSINYLQFRPTFRFGEVDGWHGYAAPGFWCYIGGLTDNPTIRDYRGYMDLKTGVQWADTFQLAGHFRAGNKFEHGSMQLDLSYPLAKITGNSFNMFLHLQYFTGYAQTLLFYDRREQALRGGFSFTRFE